MPMRLIQNSFIGGEISPSLFGRHDMEAYFHAAKEITNFHVLKTGGLRKRQGTQLLWKVATGAATATKAFAYFYDRTNWALALFYSKPNDTTVYYRVCKKDAASPGAETAIPSGVLTAADLAKLRVRQVGDTLFLTHRSVVAAKGKVDYAAGTIAWSKAAHSAKPATPQITSLTPANFGNEEGSYATTRTYCLIGVRSGVYSDPATARADIRLPWKLGATVTIAFTPSWYDADDNPTGYDYYIVGYQAAGSWMVLDMFYRGTEETVANPQPRTLIDNNMVSSSVAGVQDRMTVGDDDSHQFMVDLVDVWEQRLVMASSESHPFTLWFSRLGDVGNFYYSHPQTADDAFDTTVAALSASRILHTITARWFLMFTENGEYHIDSADKAGFAYNSITVKKTSNIGAHDTVEPVVTDSQVLFVAADARTVYELGYSLEQDNIIPQNRSFLASHMTEGDKVRKIAWAKFPEPTLLALMESGDILALTYMPEQKVCAWSRIRFSAADGVSMKCIDIATSGAIREEAGLETATEVLLVFQKTGDSTAFYVERMRAWSYGDTQDRGKAKCRDHCGYAAADWTALGKDPEADVDARVVTVRPESPDTNSMGLRKGIFDCTLRLNRSGAVTISPDADGNGLDGFDPARQDDATPAVSGADVALVTKDVKVLPRTFNNSDGRMRIRSADRWPCEILAVLYGMKVAGEGGGE